MVGALTIIIIQCIAPDNSQSDGSQSPPPNGSSAPATISSNNCHHSAHTMRLLQHIYFILDWSTDASPVMVTPRSEHAGPRVQLPSYPLGVFSIFLDNILVDLVVEETNRYAEQTLQGTEEWSTDAAEI